MVHIDGRCARRILTPKQVCWAYEKWCMGYTYVQIAEALFVCDKTVIRAFERNGFKKIRPVLTAPHELFEEEFTNGRL